MNNKYKKLAEEFIEKEDLHCVPEIILRKPHSTWIRRFAQELDEREDKKCKYCRTVDHTACCGTR